MIIWERRDGSAAALTDCLRIQTAEGLDRVRVVIPSDPTAFAAAELDHRHVHLVASRGRLLHRKQFNNGTF